MLTSAQVKTRARETGFDLCGITSAEPNLPARARLLDWLEQGMHGEMGYMARDPERRANPALVLSGARSVIVLGLNYYQQNNEPPGDELLFGHVSRYARGLDYHDVIEARQKTLIQLLCADAEVPAPDATQTFRGYVDYGPLLERSYAMQAGLGYLGKNSMLINRTYGSYFFLSAILTTIELAADVPQLNHGRCGECRRCIEACPTGAIVDDGVVDARRCLSYLTIERPTEIPRELAGRLGDNFFGCDICQEVCPHNGRAVIHTHPEFEPDAGAGEWVALDSISGLADDRAFRELFAGTPLLRPRREGLVRIADIIRRNRPKSVG